MCPHALPVKCGFRPKQRSHPMILFSLVVVWTLSWLTAHSQSEQPSDLLLRAGPKASEELDGLCTAPYSKENLAVLAEALKLRIAHYSRDGLEDAKRSRDESDLQFRIFECAAEVAEALPAEHITPTLVKEALGEIFAQGGVMDRAGLLENADPWVDNTLWLEIDPSCGLDDSMLPTQVKRHPWIHLPRNEAELPQFRTSLRLELHRTGDLLKAVLFLRTYNGPKSLPYDFHRVIFYQVVEGRLSLIMGI